MIVYLVLVIVLNAIALLAIPGTVGKERKPITPGVAAYQSALSTAVIVFATVALLRGWSV